MQLPDRKILEQIIIPYFDNGSVCFVGINKKTKYYQDLFKNQVVIIDLDKFIIKNQNCLFIQTDLKDLPKVYDKKFSCIIANGLSNFGSDSKQSIEQCFEGAFSSLENNGIFIWGWADNDERRVIDPIFINHKFSMFIFPPLNSWRYSCLRNLNLSEKYDWTLEKIIKQNHTYDFYKKTKPHMS